MPAGFSGVHVGDGSGVEVGSGVFVTVGEGGREVDASVAVVVMVTGADSGSVVGIWLLAPGKHATRITTRIRMTIAGAIFSFISDSILSLEQPLFSPDQGSCCN